MIKRHILLLILQVFMLLFMKCANTIAGGGSGAGNSIVIGGINTESGCPSPFTQVMLIPNDYNPVKDSAIQEIYIDTTDSKGRYTFICSSNKIYNIQAINFNEKTQLLITRIKPEDDTTFVSIETIKKTGSVKIYFSDTIDTENGYLYFKGTNIYKRLKEAEQINDSIYEINFVSAPAVINSTLYYGIDSNPFVPVTYKDSINIYANETTVLDLSLDWTHYTTKNSELIDNEINHISFSLETISSNPITLWIATNKGVSRVHDNSWINYTKDNSGLPSNRVLEIAVDDQYHDFQEIWFLTDSGVTCFNNHEWINYTDKSGLHSKNITSIGVDILRNRWFASNDKGLARLNRDDIWTVYDTSNGLPSNCIRSFRIDFYCNVWCATSNGVAYFDGIDWKYFTTDNSEIMSNDVYSISTKAPNIWFGFIGGVSKYSNGEWTNYIADNCSPVLNDTVFNIATNGNLENNVWFGTSKGLTLFDGNKWIDYTDERYALLKGKQIKSMVIDHFNNICLGTKSGGVIGLRKKYIYE